MPEATVKLQNRMKRMLVFNLEHATFRDGEGKPGAVTFLPLETKVLHPDALECVEVKNAVKPRSGQASLRVVA